MDDKIKMEEFDTTEIKVEEIDSDISDDWEFMSKYEADLESVPYLDVPKMHESFEENDSLSYNTSIESDRKYEYGIFSQNDQESDRVRRELDEAMQHVQQNDQENGRVRVMREIDEAMKDVYEQENDRVVREIDEAIKDVHQKEQENGRVVRKIDEAMKHVYQNEQGNDRVAREIDEAMKDVHQNEQENDRVRREIDEAMQDIYQNEQENVRITREIDEALKDVHRNDQENDWLRREIDEAIQDVPQNNPEGDKVRREIYEDMQNVPQNKQETRVRKRIDEAMLDNAFQDAYSVICLGASKVYEFIKGSDSVSNATSSKIESLNEQGIFSQHCESENRDHCKQVQFPQHEQYEESKKLSRGIDETLLDNSFPCDHEQENEKVCKEMYEVLQDITSQPSSEILLQKQPDKNKCEKENTDIQENASILSAVRCEKSQLHAVECSNQLNEKAQLENRVVQREFLVTFHKILEFNFVLPNKVSAEAAKVDNLDKGKDFGYK